MKSILIFWVYVNEPEILIKSDTKTEKKNLDGFFVHSNSFSFIT